MGAAILLEGCLGMLETDAEEDMSGICAKLINDNGREHEQGTEMLSIKRQGTQSLACGLWWKEGG